MIMSRTIAKGPALQFREVGLNLGGNAVLRDVSFDVTPGTIHCVIGPNGGGKTSLIRSLLGQMPHTGDIRIRWGSETVVGYVPQALEVDRTLPMTVGDFMTLTCRQVPAFLRLRQSGASLIGRVLERVGMAGKEALPFGGLSGGERQRVLLAQALLPRPALLILDEPDSGLDSGGNAMMQAIFLELRADGTTILMIHHDLALVRDLGDAVTCVNRSVLFTGHPDEELTADRVFGLYSTGRAA
jgi:zinc transport system ATP-binding protein